MPNPPLTHESLERVLKTEPLKASTMTLSHSVYPGTKRHIYRVNGFRHVPSTL
jgi:hypothetical protein